jgi:hypothetical protein
MTTVAAIAHFRSNARTSGFIPIATNTCRLRRRLPEVLKAFTTRGAARSRRHGLISATRSSAGCTVARRRPRRTPGLRQTINAISPPAADTPYHPCLPGNFRSTWVSQGGYEPVAEVLLAGIDYDGYFLEYDSDRAGGFEPLRFLPKGGNKKVVLGLITSKFGTLEGKDDVKRRIDEATRYVVLDQLCLSPQCGFASTQEGNVIAEDEQGKAPPCADRQRSGNARASRRRRLSERSAARFGAETAR